MFELDQAVKTFYVFFFLNKCPPTPSELAKQILARSYDTFSSLVIDYEPNVTTTTTKNKLKKHNNSNSIYRIISQTGPTTVVHYYYFYDFKIIQRHV